MLRMAVGMPTFLRTGQIGDGREAAAAAYVESHARRGDIDDVLATVDTFAREKSMLVNVGDEKGELLDAAIRRADPSRVLPAPEVLAFAGTVESAAARIDQRLTAGVDTRLRLAHAVLWTVAMLQLADRAAISAVLTH